MTLRLGPRSSAIEYLRAAPKRLKIENGCIIVAWARTNGFGLLFDALGAHLKKINVVVGMAGAATSAEALAHLLRACKAVHVFHKHHLQTFHPKIYCLDSGGVPPDQATLLVGSSNMTGGGLFSNFEANLVADLNPRSSSRDRETFESVVEAYNELVGAPYCERIGSDLRIQELLKDGYLSTETRLRRRTREDARGAARQGKLRNLPEAPPPHLPSVVLPPLEVEFAEPAGRADLKSSEGDARASGAAESEPEPPAASFLADGRFYVRTLTANDVRKLNGEQVGTFEPDLGETARDTLPGFWGWPDRFVDVTRKDTRREWAANAEIRSARTGANGVIVEIMQWYRPARPSGPSAGIKGHAAEHRIRLGPISKVREAVPEGFNTDALMVIERRPEGSAS